MQNGVLRNFTYSMMFAVREFFSLRKEDILCLVLPDFVVWLKQFVFDSDFLEIEVWVDVDIFYLKLKREAPFDEITRVKDLGDIR